MCRINEVRPDGLFLSVLGYPCAEVYRVYMSLDGATWGLLHHIRGSWSSWLSPGGPFLWTIVSTWLYI
ncbi:hypothetical protein SKAU_G00267590 [Synaphobranchus kaupii]|uniref:Uncharacterized protein n=1 Tax=Synaphobranchus kaupii TaxID=118154 RepID=A0A9Q1EZV2_SYNKA|nr:hypothetical protein SKAU_G00267590 [Synaphobranchus kaupii]